MRRHLQVGKLRIALLPEIEHQMMPISFLFSDLGQDDMDRNTDWLGTEYLDATQGKLGIAFQAYVIWADGMTILVDSCNGNRKQRPTAPWQHDLRSMNFLNNLALLGLCPEDIDVVLCTHLHCDHVGWNTRLTNGHWVPTFPKARHVFNRLEYEHYAARHAAGGPPINHGSFEDSVLPIVRAGQAIFVDAGHRVIDATDGAVFLLPSPGHSPGHVCIHARAGSEAAVVAGDVLHHPIQLDMPGLHMRADFDPEQAVRSRRDLLDRCADEGSWLLAGHIPFRSMTRVRRHGQGFRFADAAED